MHYYTISFTHKNTSIEDREKLAFNSEEELIKAYEFLKSLKNFNEAIIISTCNRVEVMLSLKNLNGIEESIFNYLSDYSGIASTKLQNFAKIYKDEDAVKHIFRVVSSLDSLVVGETQIVGQVKEAFKFSYDNGYSGQKMARVMHHAFRCAAAVRNETDISKNPISVASVAVNKAKEVLGGDLGGYSAVIVGAGDMGTLAAKHLAKNGVNIIFVNRDIEKAYRVADAIEGVNVTVEPFSELKTVINSYRLLFSATSAPDLIITKEMVKKTTFHRHWFDLAVPRDIEDCSCDNIEIYAVDDLQEIMNRNLEHREANAKIAQKIIERFSDDFFNWLQTLSIGPLIKEIRDLAKESCERELQKAISKGYVDKSDKESLMKLLHQAFNSFLHEPTMRLKNVSEMPQSDTIVQSIQYFFGLNEQQRKALDVYKCDYQIEKDLKAKDKR